MVSHVRILVETSLLIEIIGSFISITCQFVQAQKRSLFAQAQFEEEFI